MVSALVCTNGISLGQVKVDDKNNEITIPLLINSLELVYIFKLDNVV